LAAEGAIYGVAGRGRKPVRTRLCAVTRTELPVDELIRFVVGPDERIFPDLACRLPGRGVWVAATHGSVAKAVKTKAFARSLKRTVAVGEDLADEVARLLHRRLPEALALANKAGLVVAGFSKVEEAIASGRLATLIHASDASHDGVAKLDGKYARLARLGAAATARPPRIDRSLSSAELSLALGRSNVIHAALTAGGAANRFERESERLERYLVDKGARQAARTPGVKPFKEGDTE